jgi:hypothetical protein
LVITPTLGQSGTANITVSIADGAKRTASATFAATVTKPTPPTVSVTAGASQSLTEGAATTPVSFTATDAYGQSGSGTAVVTVNAPAGKGGGSLDLMTLMALAALVLWTASTRRERPADPRASAAGW